METLQTLQDELIKGIGEIRRTVAVMMKNVWSVSELALVLGISESRVRHMAAEHQFPVYRRNGSLFFKREEIEAWQTRERSASNDELADEAAEYCARKRPDIYKLKR